MPLSLHTLQQDTKHNITILHVAASRKTPQPAMWESRDYRTWLQEIHSDIHNDFKRKKCTQVKKLHAILSSVTILTCCGKIAVSLKGFAQLSVLLLQVLKKWSREEICAFQVHGEWQPTSIAERSHSSPTPPCHRSSWHLPTNTTPLHSPWVWA